MDSEAPSGEAEPDEKTAELLCRQIEKGILSIQGYT